MAPHARLPSVKNAEISRAYGGPFGARRLKYSSRFQSGRGPAVGSHSTNRHESPIKIRKTRNNYAHLSLAKACRGEYRWGRT